MTQRIFSSLRSQRVSQLLRREFFWLVCVSLAVAGLMLGATTFTSATDSLGSLLTSQAILQHGTVKLDNYREAMFKEPTPYNYQIIRHAGHLYCFYPVGTPLFALPAVAVARLLGLDMSNDQHDRWLQRILAAWSVTLAFVLAYLLVRAWLGPRSAMLVTLAMTAGSSIFSTMGTALWGFDFETLFLLLSLLMVVRGEIANSRWQPYLLGILLFGAYLCRPTAAIFILAICTWLLWTNWRALVRVCSVMAFLSLILIAFSWHEYRLILPPYYLPQKMLDPTSFWKGLYGSLFSASRGLFIFSPQVLVVVAGLFLCRRALTRDSLILCVAGCALLHIVMIARWKDWWAGFSFGPRYFTDAMPAFLLLAAWLMKQMIESPSKRVRTAVLALFFVASMWSVFVNTWQGLYNRYTGEWNLHPNVSQHPDVVFDWETPQFIASERLIQKRIEKYRK